MNSNELLDQLAKDWGYDSGMELIEDYALQSVVPGICKRCNYSTDVEPDQYKGWCEECDEGTVVSCLALAGII
jgi:hypothetical protein